MVTFEVVCFDSDWVQIIFDHEDDEDVDSGRIDLKEMFEAIPV